MRVAIRQKLVDLVTSVQGRVFEPHVPGKDTPKPYLVVKQGVDVEDSPWVGFRRIVEIWPYLARTSFKELDALEKAVKDALHWKLLTDSVTGEVFTCNFLGTVGQDYVDPDWDAITRGLRFGVVALQATIITETISNDTWLEALATWTATLLGGTWTVYRNFWPLGYKRPSVMWRLARVKTIGRGKTMFEIQKEFIGHIAGDTPNRRITAGATIVQGLASAIKIVLDAVNRRYLTVIDPASDDRLDALTGGQISVTLSRITARPEEEAPLIAAVHVRDDIE